MKKIFTFFTILFFIISFQVNFAIAVSSSQVAEITKIENDLFGFDYFNEEIENRVSRLEKNIYGKNFNGNLTDRIKKLCNDLTSEQIGQEINPTEDTFKEIENIADNTVNYPIVDEIEMKIFNTTYKNRDFHTRIVTIERKLFGKIYDAEDYSTRMDRIKSEVVPERLAREKVFGYDNTDESINSQSLSSLNNNLYTGKKPYGQERYIRPYANYGDFTGGATAPNEEFYNEDLAQLEYATFGTEFSNDDTQSRIRRLNSANRAKQSSSKYDSAKFQQRMSTAMEIGAMLLMILAMIL